MDPVLAGVIGAVAMSVLILLWRWFKSPKGWRAEFIKEFGLQPNDPEAQTRVWSIIGGFSREIEEICEKARRVMEAQALPGDRPYLRHDPFGLLVGLGPLAVELSQVRRRVKRLSNLAKEFDVQRVSSIDAHVLHLVEGNAA